ncbi:nitroreductase family protein [Leucobacter soli]|uniref:Putative NAD(P)H nitroreductase n=1 Tax=Leucobacter soli TaxID=2812850 RepID=A0A916K1K2_9MICO|nr:nitroreductase family protein [Leucobacter soli]CAG7620971.1 Putative NAD(P)H nitroreductase YdjA [Leucobacter soli]
MSTPQETHHSAPALDAVRARRSYSSVTESAPSREEIEGLLAAMSSVADHSALRPWRIIELRGDARKKLGKALAKGGGMSLEKGLSKAMRAPLVLAVVVSPRKSKKVPLWEQEAVASGVAHYLGLLLHEAGWGVIWRTGEAVRSQAARKTHELEKHEYLLGWLYVGGVEDRRRKHKPRKPLDVSRHLSAL